MVLQSLGGAAVRQIGVEAVVAQVDKFLGDLGKMNKGMEETGKGASFLSKVFEPVNRVLSAVAGTFQRIFEITTGIVIARTLEKIGELISNIAGAALEAGENFQQLSIRLEGLIATELVNADDALDFNQALKDAIPLTQDLFFWVQQLALSTPFSTAQVADVLTLAKSYGFTAEEAKGLTETIVDFASGMGLGNLEITRIIENFGQMKAAGKITGTELRDLARGAFVPVNDVMAIMADNLSGTSAAMIDNSAEISKLQDKLTGLKDKLEVALLRQSEFTEDTKESTRLLNQQRIDKYRAEIEQTSSSIAALQKTQGTFAELTTADIKEMIKEGTAAEAFFEAFTTLVGERFAGAGERAGRTFAALKGNIKDLLIDVVGLNVIKPILDSVSGNLSDLLAALVTGETGERLTAALFNIGQTMAGVFDEIFTSLDIDFEAIGQSIVSFLEGLPAKIESIKQVFEALFAGDIDIGTAVGGILERLGVPQSVLDTYSNLLGFINNIKQGFEDIKPTLQAAFDALTEGNVVAALGLIGAPDAVVSFVGNIQKALENLALFWDTNGEAITAALDQIFSVLLGTAITGGETALDVIGNQILRFSESLAGEGGTKLTENLQKFADFMTEKFLPLVDDVFNFISENQDGIANLIIFANAMEILFKVFIAAAAVASVIAIFVQGIATFVGLLPAIIAAATPILALAAAIAILIEAWIVLGPAVTETIDQLGFIITFKLMEAANAIRDFGQRAWEGLMNFVLLVGSVIILIGIEINKIVGVVLAIGPALWGAAQDIWNMFWLGLGARFNQMVNVDFPNLLAIIAQRIRTFVNLFQVGRDIVSGLWDGFKERWNFFLVNIASLFFQFQAFIKGLLGISSPSTVMAEIGEQLMEGLAQGIANAANLPAAAMEAVAGMVVAPAMAAVSAAPTTTNNVSTNNAFNLTVNSNAQIEPIVQDFGILQSMASGS